ncbi:hypothetical protein [Acetobacterium wieringae]|uniref:hypothetical protein n=1 Tax=Acetobacterium wieringae TaxID=52694 RepID=UPI0026EF5A45|nr:hypothetical protein [Acetobacterium wieringae]
MNVFEKYTNSIKGNHLSMLLDSVENRDDYLDIPEFLIVADEFVTLMNQIEDKALFLRLEKMLDDLIYLAKYQGFKIGFNEAFNLLKMV